MNGTGPSAHDTEADGRRVLRLQECFVTSAFAESCSRCGLISHPKSVRCVKLCSRRNSGIGLAVAQIPGGWARDTLLIGRRPDPVAAAAAQIGDAKAHGRAADVTTEEGYVTVLAAAREAGHGKSDIPAHYVTKLAPRPNSLHPGERSGTCGVRRWHCSLGDTALWCERLRAPDSRRGSPRVGRDDGRGSGGRCVKLSSPPLRGGRLVATLLCAATATGYDR